MGRLPAVTARVLRATLVLAVVATGCGGEGASSSSRTRRDDATSLSWLDREIETGVVPGFVDVTAEAGLDLPFIAPAVNDCILGADELRRRFGRVIPSDLDDGSVALCQVERFTGGVSVGDFDSDGWGDLYVPRLDGPGRLFRNLGSGRFADVTAGSGLELVDEPTAGAAWADFDRDGSLDLIVNTIAGTRAYLYMGDGRGGFVEQGVERGLALDVGSVSIGFSATVGDLDADGFADVFLSRLFAGDKLSNYPTAVSRLLHNRGPADPGRFEDWSGSALGLDDPSTREKGLYAFGASFADLDVDGRPDLYVTGDFGTSRLYWNLGGGEFRERSSASGVGTEENGMGSTSVDLTGDGIPDRIVTGVFDARGDSLSKGGNWGASGNRLFVNDGDRAFEDVTDAAGIRDGQWGWGVAVFDPANIGVNHIVQTSGLDDPNATRAAPYISGPTFVWRAAIGRFEPVADRMGLDVEQGRAIATLDYDGDGLLDLVVGRPGSSIRLFRNVTTGGGNWLRVVARGSASDPNGLGARVEVTTPDGARRVVEIGAGADFLAQDEAVAHVGLGRSPKAATVVVRFLSGAVVEQRDVAANQVVTVREPSG